MLTILINNHEESVYIIDLKFRGIPEFILKGEEKKNSNVEFQEICEAKTKQIFFPKKCQGKAKNY